MLKKTITYEDYDGTVLTEDFYFHLSKAELVELEVAQKGGLAEKMKQIVESEDGAKIIATFKEIILTSYGIRSEDGKRFIKSEDIRNQFAQTQAYSALFMELSTDANAAAEFIEGIIPAGLAKEIEKSADSEVKKLKDPTSMSKEELLELLNKK